MMGTIRIPIGVWDHIAISNTVLCRTRRLGCEIRFHHHASNSPSPGPPNRKIAKENHNKISQRCSGKWRPSNTGKSSVRRGVGLFCGWCKCRRWENQSPSQIAKLGFGTNTRGFPRSTRDSRKEMKGIVSTRRSLKEENTRRARSRREGQVQRSPLRDRVDLWKPVKGENVEDREDAGGALQSNR